MALKRPSVRAMGVAALVAALAFASTLAGLKWHRSDQVQAELDVRDAVADRAVGVATNLFTYDYRNLAVTERYLSGAATGAFAQREAAHEAAVRARLREAQAVGTATVEEVSVSDVSDDHATAFVVLTTHVSSVKSGSTDAIAYLHLDLRIVDGVWKVDDVQNLSAQSS